MNYKEVVCISGNVNGLTRGRKYEVLGEDKKWKWKDYELFLLKNDLGEEVWYNYCPYGVIELLPTTNDWIRYDMNTFKNIFLTHNKIYQLLYREDDGGYYYFLDDRNELIGKVKSLFKLLTKEEVREIKLEKILTYGR